MQRVFLVGARASGKSTIGRSLAETLGCPFLDTDKELTRDLGCSIDVFVKENGWDAFRRKEHETLKRLAGAGEKKQDGEWLVIATGGGKRALRSTWRHLWKFWCGVSRRIRCQTRAPHSRERGCSRKLPAS